jgi:isochorismate synthase
MKEDLLHQPFNTALQLGVNFAAIRLPDNKDVYYFYTTAQPEMVRLQYTTTQQPVFFCSPYSAGHRAYALVPDAVYKNDACIYGGLPPSTSPRSKWHEGANNTNFIADDAFYQHYVQAIVAQIETGDFDKAVAARCMPINTPDATAMADFFEAACAKYPNACIYFFSIAGIGTWFGATPERLVSTKNNTLETVALAGTLPVDSTLEWTQKEIDEQGMIEFFIHQVFESNGFKKINLGEVETITAGAVNSNEVILSAKFHHVLNALNPTPAVCGLPQMEASLFIAQQEKLERRFYSGFVGVHLPKTAIELYVNIRCAELFNNQALLYAGAGITAQSVAAKELVETNKKLDIIRSLFLL